MDGKATDRARLLHYALPPRARHPRFRRDFSEEQRTVLRRQLNCTTDQVNRLQRILPAIVYCGESGAKLADVRKQLETASKHLHRASQSVLTLLNAPESQEAPDEARLCLLKALHELYPERCVPDPYHTSFHEFGPLTKARETEAHRLLIAMHDLQAAAEHAIQRMPKAQTRAVAHPYPVALIEAALNVDGENVKPSESMGSRFREIVGVCYTAARVQNGDPLRAIREYLQQSNGSPEK